MGDRISHGANVLWGDRISHGAKVLWGTEFHMVPKFYSYLIIEPKPEQGGGGLREQSALIAKALPNVNSKEN